MRFLFSRFVPLNLEKKVNYTIYFDVAKGLVYTPICANGSYVKKKKKEVFFGVLSNTFRLKSLRLNFFTSYSLSSFAR